MAGIIRTAVTPHSAISPRITSSAGMKPSPKSQTLNYPRNRASFSIAGA
jgi:hypothetical protein